MEEERTSYPFKTLKNRMAEGKLLAKSYKMSFNKLLDLLLEDAIEEWSVPGHEVRKRPDEREITVDQQKSLT